ncbi:MAG: T9SS type A sorting domain-containing protein [Bacteroidia bacterium]|nr:T9SS type A sorting domain-containing protein [Bacteroidia bacterium]
MNRYLYIIVSVLCLLSSTGKAQYFSNRYDNFNNGDNNTGMSYFEHQYLTYGCTANTNSLYSLNLGINSPTGSRTISRTYNYFSNLFVPHSGRALLHHNQQFTIAGTRFYKTDTSWVFLWRFDSNLDSVKYTEYGYLNKINQVFSVIKGSGNAVYMAGSVDSLYKNADILLIKTDTSGNEIWKKKIGIPLWDETAYSISMCSNSNLLISGLKGAHGGSTQGPFVMRLDSSGAVLWENFYPSSTYANASFDVKEMTNGDIVFTGGKAFNITPNGTLRKPTLTRLTASGTLVWQKEYGRKEVGHDFFTFLINEKNNFVVSGEIFRPDNTASGMVYVINQNGDSLLCKEYRILPNSQNYFRDVVQAPDKGYCFSGFVSPMNGDGGTQDIWLLKVDSNFCESNASCVTGMDDSYDQNGISVFPNPASDELQITFDNSLSSTLVFELSDAQGRMVLQNTITNNVVPHKVSLSNFAEGVYFYRVSGGTNYLKTGKIVVIK